MLADTLVNRSRMMRVAFWLVVAGISVYPMQVAVRMLRAAAAETTRLTPYTVRLRQIVIHASGASSEIGIHTQAARTDGSRLFANSVDTGQGPESTRYIEFANGTTVTISDLWEIKTSVRMVGRSSYLAWHSDPGRQCIYSLAGGPRANPIWTFLSEELVDGFRAARISHGGGHMVWYALDHGCALLKSQDDFGAAGGSAQTLLSLIPGEPDPALFHVPVTFREVPPSEFDAIGRQKLGIQPCAGSCTESMRARDQRYFENRPQ